MKRLKRANSAILAILFVQASVILPLAAHQAAETTAGDLVYIDGATNPERLPEYLVWQNVLSGIALLKGKEITAPFASLQSTEAERRRIFAAAESYVGHRSRCAERQRRTAAMLRDRRRRPKEVETAQKAIILECRQEVLDQAQSLLNDLSYEARDSLLRWIELRKAGMKSTVPRSELEFYRKPR